MSSEDNLIVENSNKNNDSVSVPELIGETIVREVTPTKKCVKEDAHICFKCCVYSWSFTLNGCECCCGGLSELCLGMSRIALCFKNSLEVIDCDSRTENK
jgi:hypothetical protein